MLPWVIAIGITAYLGLLATLRYEERKSSQQTQNDTLQRLPQQDEQLQAMLQKYPTALLRSQPPTTGTDSNDPVAPVSSGSGSNARTTTPAPSEDTSMGNLGTVGITTASSGSSGYSESGTAPSGGVGVASG